MNNNTNVEHEQILNLLFSIPILKKERLIWSNGECILFTNGNLYYISDDKTEIRFLEKNVIDLYINDNSLYYKTDKMILGFCGQIRENPYEFEYIL